MYHDNADIAVKRPPVPTLFSRFLWYLQFEVSLYEVSSELLCLQYRPGPGSTSIVTAHRQTNKNTKKSEDQKQRRKTANKGEMEKCDEIGSNSVQTKAP